ncbi:hypothetical protein [Blastococcus capsensis]|uniref:hypothetical protein n=1 Tax=Blastococcus capsensis TaxID=1564163 RepID=UPI0025415C60|nr:hypothetical protein [Blastococcus capsensis]MDK3257683.1 hypothetical protein [Blastococcus capsensis]
MAAAWAPRSSRPPSSAASPDHPDALDVLAPVALGNEASWRALRRAGATWYAEGELTPDNEVDPRDHVVHRFRR